LLSEIILDANLEDQSHIALWFKCPTVLALATANEVPTWVDPLIWHNAGGFVVETVNEFVERLLEKGFSIDEETKFKFDWIPEDTPNEVELSA
jgi:hypothetical protein